MWKLRVTYETAREDELRQGEKQKQQTRQSEWTGEGGVVGLVDDAVDGGEEEAMRVSEQRREARDVQRETVAANENEWTGEGARRRCLVDSAVNGGEGEAMRVSEQWTTALESEEQWTMKLGFNGKEEK